MARFSKHSTIAAPAEIVFAFHEAPEAFQRLQPPWQKVEILQPPKSLAIGTKVVLRVKMGPLWQTIEAEHVEYQPGKMFADRMVRGPFRSWYHRHIVVPIDETRCLLKDDIEYDLPLGLLGRLFGAPIARRQLARLFEYRHQVTRRDCEDAAGRKAARPDYRPTTDARQ